MGPASILLSLIVWLQGCPAQAAPSPHPFDESRSVRRVIDGDTVEFSDGKRARLIGLDAPEYQPWDHREEPYGRESAACAESLLEGRRVRLELGEEAQDAYNRILAYLFLEDGRMANEVLVAQGCARERYHPPNGRYRMRLQAAEREAKRSRRGLWQTRFLD